MSENTSELNNELKDTGNLYEVGFHVLPTLTEEEAIAELASVTSFIEKSGGVIKKSHNPQMRELSYEMTKVISGKKQNFGNAYFGHLVFQIEPGFVGSVRKDIEILPNVLRALILEVSPESLLPREQRVRDPSRDLPKLPTDEKLESIIPQMSEAELDKTIEALVIE